ncbi:ATP-binding protein [Clostridium botulinum]|uniref:AAA family ATPase n=1 Tax=Clostridium botulinum TaxID=1491 RepID=UPI001967A720|nr:AAA family ATPase [Clostridium botulinum]MBN1075017.1 ATP-binding protein [Clostridium botulinum]
MFKVEDLLLDMKNKLFEKVGSIYKHDDFIIVGNNMSGKSWVIMELLKSNISESYLIDSINRTIANNDPRGRFKDIINKQEILIERVKVKNFNRIDTITSIYNNSLIYNELTENLEAYSDVINNYFGKEFKVEEKEDNDGLFSDKKYVYKLGDDEYSELSNGFQAIVRILVEVVFALSLGVKAIAIDEIDLHLDSEQCKKMIQFLRINFKEIKWVFTTHSSEVILASKDFNILKIENGYCNYFDGNDMENIPYINRMLFEPNTLNRNPIDNELSNLLRLKAIGKNIDEDILKINSYDNLTVKQTILRDYLVRWNNED